MTSTKKVLIIAYYFPPGTEVGGIRAAKFCRYLPEYGWQPYALTVNEKYYPNVDLNRLKDIEKSQVIRTSQIPVVTDVLVNLRNKVVSIFRTKETPALSSSNSSLSSINSTSNNKHKSERSGLIRFLESIFELPDKNVGWLMPALWAGYKAVRKEKIEVIIATSPPATAGIIGLTLSYITGAKFIIDLRDPLMLHERKPPIHRTWLSDIIERHIEKTIYSRSYKVISATESYTKHLRTLNPHLPASKFDTVWNGFDSSDFPLREDFKDKRNDKFVINYLGSFYSSRSPRSFLQALESFISEERIEQKQLEVNFIGDVMRAESMDTEALVGEYKLSNVITIHGKVSYPDALKSMYNANLLLLIAPEDMNRYSIPAKTFEYLYANQNVLCLTGKTATGDLLNNLNIGYVVDISDTEKIKHSIKNLYEKWSNHEPPNSVDNISFFERKEQTRKLAELLN